MQAAAYLPLFAFVALALAEFLRGDASWRRYAPGDHALNLAGLAIQGMLVPQAGYLIATRLLAPALPELAGTLALGWIGALALNLVVVDFLYYWEHRAFHRWPLLWALHRCHHASPTVSVWATSRNALAINFLFVYLLVNPLLGFLCDAPAGFFFGASLTASLDLWRHSRISGPAGLDRVLVTPRLHHRHHARDGADGNFGANLIVWDRWFGTARAADAFPTRYGVAGAPPAWRQFLFPW